MGELYLGTQSWSHKEWVGPFYPEGTTPTQYITEYAHHFNSVEIDSTFYGIPRETTVYAWRDRTPDGFIFAAKFPQVITHEKMLADAQMETQVFLATMSLLGEKLGPLLLQFSYEFGPDKLQMLDTYLAELPPGYRVAVEVRNRRWLQPEFFDLLKRHQVALALQDLYYMPRHAETTAPFTYIRWLGDRQRLTRFDHIQLDRSKEQAWWAEQVRAMLDRGMIVYGYFNDQWAGHAPASVRQFHALVNSPPVE
jgi:uncharacterized protein YecE (DUF72 family)